MKIIYPISTTREEARRRLEELGRDLAPQYNLTVRWFDDQGDPYLATWKRPGASGEVTIAEDPTRITVSGRLGILGLAESRIVARVQELLAERFPPGERAPNPWQPAPQVIQQQQGGGIDWAAAGKAALGLVHGLGGALANAYSGGATKPLVDYLGRTYEETLGIPYQESPSIGGLFSTPPFEDFANLDRLFNEQNPELWRRTIRALRREPIEGVSASQEEIYQAALRVARALYSRSSEKLPGGDSPNISAIVLRFEKEAEDRGIFKPRKTASSGSKYLGF